MKLRILGDIYFQDIRRSIPVGIFEDVSKEFLFFVKETCNAAQRDIMFASIYDNPDYSERSLITPVDGLFCASKELPCVLIFVRPEVCTEIVALHELMHAYLYFTEGYNKPRRPEGCFPFHIKFFVSLIGNIALDMHTNERLQQRGFAIDPLRERYFRALEEHRSLFERTRYSDDVDIQWQIGAMWGHMLAGAHFYHPSRENLKVHRQLDEFCRRHSRGTIRFRNLVVETFRKTGYDTSQKVEHFIDEVTPKLLKALGELACPEHLQRSHQQQWLCWEHEMRHGDILTLKGAKT